LLLSDVGIDSVTIVKCQHSSMLLDLLDNKQSLTANFRDIESRKISLGESMYPTPNRRLWRGSYSSPFPPTSDKP
jgi:hypothetical protein